MAATFDRILVIVTRQLGDVLLTTPLISAARARWPSARIDVLGFNGTLGLLRGNPDVTELVEIERGGGWRTALALLRRLWRRYDLALVTQESDRAHLYAFIAAPLRAGVVPPERKHAWWKRRLLRHVVVSAGDRGETHVADEKLALLDPWRSAAERRPTLPVVAPAGGGLPPELVAVLGPSPIVIQVPSMWRYKQWPLAHYRELVAALLRDGHQVVLTGSGAAEDRAKVASLADLGAAPQLLDMAGALDLNALTTLLARAALYIGPDTSVTHLAASLGVPVVAVFGPSNPMRWGPLGPVADGAAGFVRNGGGAQRRGRVIVMQGPNPCVPCGRAGCDDHRDSASACLEAIGAGLVLAEANRLLRAGGASAAAGAL